MSSGAQRRQHRLVAIVVDRLPRDIDVVRPDAVASASSSRQPQRRSIVLAHSCDVVARSHSRQRGRRPCSPW
jgi:hypothetical protein